MKVRKIIVCFAALAAAAFIRLDAKTCTWIGPVGGNGNWSSADNWDDGAKPADGDDIVFSSGSASTNDIGEIEVANMSFASASSFEVGGEYKLSVSSGGGFDNDGPTTSLKFRCPVELMGGAHTSRVGNVRFFAVVTGPGDLYHEGTELSFGRDMPKYTGSIFATNAVVYPQRDHEYGHNSALGRSNEVHVAKLAIVKNGTWTHSSCKIYIYCNVGSTDQSFQNFAGDIRICGPTYIGKGGGFRITPHTAAFNDTIYVNGTMILTLEGNSSMTLNAPFKKMEGASTAVLYCDQAGTVNFNAAGNEYTEAQFYTGRHTVLSFNTAGAMAEVNHVFGQDAGAIVVTQGDQTCRRIAANCSGVNHYVTSTVPATITIKGDYQHAFSGPWQGGLTLRWNPTWATTYTLSAAIEHTMSGRLISDKGTLILTSGSSFPNLSGIEVASGATIKIPENVTINPVMDEIVLGATASLNLATNENVTVKRLIVNGEKYWGTSFGAPIVYGGDACAVQCDRISQIKGGGTITVTARNPDGLILYVR